MSIGICSCAGIWSAAQSAAPAARPDPSPDTLRQVELDTYPDDPKPARHGLQHEFHCTVHASANDYAFIVRAPRHLTASPFQALATTTALPAFSVPRVDQCARLCLCGILPPSLLIITARGRCPSRSRATCAALPLTIQNLPDPDEVHSAMPSSCPGTPLPHPPYTAIHLASASKRVQFRISYL